MPIHVIILRLLGETVMILHEAIRIVIISQINALATGNSRMLCLPMEAHSYMTWIWPWLIDYSHLIHIWDEYPPSLEVKLLCYSVLGEFPREGKTVNLL